MSDRTASSLLDAETKGRSGVTCVAAAAGAIEAHRLCKSIDDRPILRDLEWQIPAGAYVALLGANGAGKSTVIRLISMLMSPSSGELRVFGESTAKASSALRRRIGVIGHQAMLYRELSVRENLVLFGGLYGLSRREAMAKAEELLELVGLSSRGGDLVRELSRGMVQRIAIARALMHDPDLLLADEPFSGLDAPSAEVIESLLTQLHRQGKTILLANHDIAQSLRLAERVIVLRRGTLVVDAMAGELDAARVLREICD